MPVVANLFETETKPETKKNIIPDLFKEDTRQFEPVSNLFKREKPKASFIDEGLLKPVKTFYSGILKSASNTADTLKFYSDQIAVRLNIPETKNSIFEILKNNWKEYGEKLEKEGLTKGLTEKIYKGLGEAGWEVPKLMALGAEGLVVSSAAEGGKAGGVKGAVEGATSGALTKGVLKGLGTLPFKAKVPTAFVSGAVMTPGGAEEKIAGGATFAGLSLPGKSVSMGEFKQVQKNSPLVKGYNKISERFEGIYQNYVNRMQSIENITEKAKKLGANIEPGKDPGLQARAYLGIGGKVKAVLEDKTYRVLPNGKFEITGEGLKPILNDYDKLSPEKNISIREKDLSDYLMAQRTIKDLQRPKSEFSEENIVSPEQVKSAQDTLNNLGKKYGVTQPILKPSEKAPVSVGQPIPPELEPLAIEARKYKSVEEFVRVSQAHGMGAGRTSEGFDAEAFGKAVSIVGKKTWKELGYKDLTDFYNQATAKLSTPTGEGEIQRVANNILKNNPGISQKDAEAMAKDVIHNRPYNKTDSINIPHLEQTAIRLYEYQKRVLSNLVDSGNLSQEQYNAILEKNPNYVPFDRVIENVDTAGTPVSKNRFTGARSPIKAIKGSEKEIHNPIESMIKNTYKIMDIAERNKVARSVADLSKILPEDISPVKVSMRPVNITEKEVGGEAKTIFRPSQFKPKGNVIEYFDNGKRKYIEVTPNLYQAMTGLNETSVSLFTKIMSIPATTLRTGATITPEFMFRNPLRDQWTAFMQTKLGYKPFIDSSKSIADILGKTDAYYDWLRSGGAYSGFVELSRPNLKRQINLLKNNKKLLSKLNIINDAQDLSQLFEQATRIGVYKSAVKKGLSPAEAGFQSREATVDFGRKGSRTKDINAMIAFFNAGVQGSDKFIRKAEEDPAGFAAKGTAVITIPSIVSYILARKDPEYKEIPRWQKDLFWCFKVNDTWVRVPKPFSYGQIFGSLPERFMEYLDTKDKSAFDNLTKSIYDSLTPVSGDLAGGLLATGIRPLVENASNWSFFRQKPIVSESQKNLLPSQQYGRYNTETSKLAGKILNYSPAKIENLVQGWFGGLGRYALQASDLVVNKMEGKTTPKRPSELSDIPLIKGFVVRRPQGSQSESVSNFYDNMDKITQVHSTIKKYYRENNSKIADDLKQKYPEFKAYSGINRTAKVLADLSRYSDYIIGSNLSDKEKRLKLKEIDEKKTSIAIKANKIVETLRNKNKKVVQGLF